MLVFGPHENLTTLVASFSDKPIEDKTWLGVYDAEVQAEPVEISARSFKHIMQLSIFLFVPARQAVRRIAGFTVERKYPRVQPEQSYNSPETT